MTAHELKQGIERTREHLGRRWPVAVVAGVLVAGSVIIRRRRRRT